MTRTSHSFLDATDDLQLDLMEKDIVIEQLRNQLKQLRSKLAVMEEEQAADTAPLQGLLNQLGELKVRASIRTGGGLLLCRLYCFCRRCCPSPHWSSQ